MLDPACGDGRFLVAHPNSVGVEHDPQTASIAQQQAADSVVHEGDFFTWAEQTAERFDCAAGNPPFIRYQRFSGEVRETALRLCRRHGARFNALTSSWAPFLVSAATLLKPGGRMAFVVPAEIGHAPYVAPLLYYLAGHFEFVQVVAIRKKLFPEISEDCWLLFCRGFGGHTESFAFSTLEEFAYCDRPPRVAQSIPFSEWQRWKCRLRPFLLRADLLALYDSLATRPDSLRLGQLAQVSVGYVTGANDFFHLRPSQATRMGIPDRLLVPAVRSGKSLRDGGITSATVSKWTVQDEPNFLLHLSNEPLPRGVRDYLDSPDGQLARQTYKCRNRRPWYVVPDVRVADAFLSYMSGGSPALVANAAGCVATNSVHLVRLHRGARIRDVQSRWNSELTRLSCEIEGHPLGGGMLKLEPREAAQVLLGGGNHAPPRQAQLLVDAVETMRCWRHYG
jgi:hypothetical protein